MRKIKGPKFIRYFDPVIQALKELGGSGTPSEVTEIVARLENISEAEQSEVLKSGGLRFPNQVAFARQYLVWRGYLGSSNRGVWVLTDCGRAVERITPEESLRIFQEEHAKHQRKDGTTISSEPISEEQVEEEEKQLNPEIQHREELLKVLKGLTPSGFENLCKRLLRESGFEKVDVTGRPNDKGIDGIGVLQVNTFVSFKVLFQCKRYAATVSRAEVGDFRNSMMGRADKGIILTTGTFSREARNESVRDGATPIELVDGEKLIEMFEKLQLGLKPKTVYAIDYDFFEEFKA